jgi:hypothetical protein
MTDDEIRKFIHEHRHWSYRRKLAFVKANIEIDVDAVATRLANEAVDAAVRDGLLVSTGNGKMRVAGEIGPADVQGLARILAQRYRPQ